MEDSQGTGSAVPADEALASFVLLAKFLGVPAEPAQIHHDRGQGDRPYDFDDLIRIAKKLDLMARRKRATVSEFPKLPLPALVALRGRHCHPAQGRRYRRNGQPAHGATRG